ncbi:MAG: glycosyltransferase family 9 protein, partial [Chloroflexota bacterium]
YWADVASRLVDDGATIVLVGGPETRRLADEIKTRSGRTIVDLVGKTSVLELLAVLERASVVVSGDSGPLHLAVALHCPTVGIFGPTDPRISGPYQAPNAVVVRHDLPCSPCYRLDRVADCPLGHTLCQRLITPNAVYHAVRATLEHVAGSR